VNLFASPKRLVRRPVSWIITAVILSAIAFALVRARGPRVRTVLATKRELEQHVVASGRVMPPARVTVAANVSGLVVAVGALEGQHVKRGDLLVQIDDAEARAQVAQAKAAVAQANAKVEQLRRVGAIVAGQGLNQAQANLDKAQTDFDRTKNLVTSGSLAQSFLDEAQRALDVARAQKNAAEAQQLGSAPMGADSRVALTALMQAQAQLTGADVRLSQTTVAAAHDGVLLTRTVEVGDTVQPGRALMTMAADGDVELVFEPDERNLATMALGQKAKASADAFPRDVFDANVSYIAPSIDPARGTVEVRLRVPAPPPFLKPDMTVSIDLTVANKKDALVVRSDAVRGMATPSPWVLVFEEGRAQRKDVKLGLAGDGALEIVSGVAPGAEVVVADGQSIRPGQRVRAAREEP
jgi:HlyD family secretion protein